jgi:hypothetical protein
MPWIYTPDPNPILKDKEFVGRILDTDHGIVYDLYERAQPPPGEPEFGCDVWVHSVHTSQTGDEGGVVGVWYSGVAARRLWQHLMSQQMVSLTKD